MRSSVMELRTQQRQAWFSPVGGCRSLEVWVRVLLSWLALQALTGHTPGLGVAGSTSNIYSSGCTGHQLQLTCPKDHKIAIKRVFYGVKRNWDCPLDSVGYRTGHEPSTREFSVKFNSSSECCRASSSDCQLEGETMYPALNTKCSGYSSCELEVLKMATREPCRHKSHTEYMTIVYDCISASDIATFCSDDVKRGKSLYLANKEYPAAIRPRAGGEECQCIVRTSHPQGIGIHAIDVLLAWAETGPVECRRTLKIQDPMFYYKDIQCAQRGFYGFRSIYSRPVSNVTVALSSQPGDGMAFVWLQVRANDAEGTVEVFCGQSLQDLVSRIRHQSESRQREEDRKQSQDRTTEDQDQDRNKGAGRNSVENERTSHVTTISNVTSVSGLQSMNSDLAAISGGIVAATFFLLALVIIAVALHCKRLQKREIPRKSLPSSPVSSTEQLDMSSYCRYDYEDEPATSNKMTPTSDRSGLLATSFKPNGFTTLSHTDRCMIHRDAYATPPLPPGISTPPPSSQSHPLLSGRTYKEVHYPGDTSLRFVKPLVHSNHNLSSSSGDISSSHQHPGHHPLGHTTLPSHKKTVLITCGPKSPLGKRSKSVTFSQPVAMVTPLNSESEESMEKSALRVDMEEPSYDNLHKLDIPDYPASPGSFYGWGQQTEDSLALHKPAILSTFLNGSCSPHVEAKVVIKAPSEVKMNGDPVDLGNLVNTPSGYWSPTKHNGKPLTMPKPQKAELYETGV